MSRRRRDDASNTPRRRFSPASLLFLGLIIGLAGSLYYTWIVAPVVYVDASPARFSEQQKAEYIFLVSQSLAVENDWEQARRRLEALGDPALTQTVTTLLEAYVREQRPADVIRNMAVLAQQLGADAPAVSLFAPTPLSDAAPTATATATTGSTRIAPTAVPSPTPIPTNTRRPTATAVPTRTPEPTTQPTYRLLNQQRLCPADAAPARIEVVTLDALLNPLPGVEVFVRWDGGADHFFTGFKPALGAGAGDFTMRADVSYTVALADGSPEISGLRIEQCDDGLDGGWRLTFQNLLLQPETPQPQ